MKRRSFLTGAAGGAAASTIAAPAIAQERFEWTMVMPWPRNAPGVGVNAVRLAENITAMSDGRLTVTPYGAGELVPPFESFDAVQAGSADCLHGTPYYWTGKSLAFHFFTGVPFGFNAMDLPGWLRFGGGQDMWDEAYSTFGLKPFYVGSSGVQAGGWFRQEINSVDDLRGLRIRIAGLGGEVMRRLGAAVVLTPPGEIFAAMQSGNVDAAEWVAPWNDLGFGLHQVADYYYLPAFHEPGPGLEFSVNQARWEELPADLQAIVHHAAASCAHETLADFHYHNVEALEPLVNEHGVQIRVFPDAVIAELGRVTQEMLAELSAEDEGFGRVWESYSAHLMRAARYGHVMAEAMERQRASVLLGS